MEKKEPKFYHLWWKLLVSAIILCSPLIIISYLYFQNSSCNGSWGCLEFELLMFGGGVFLFSLPIVFILFLWELWKKFNSDKEQIKY